MHSNTFRYSLLTTALVAGLSVSAATQASFLAENEVALGFQNTLVTGGLSAKLPFGDGLTLQGVIGSSGTLTNFSARGLLEFSELNEESVVYAFVGAGVWTFRGSRFVNRETAIGVTAGVGVDWDLQQSNPDWLPISLSAEVGASLVAFDDYAGFDLFSLGFGAHYRF